MVKREYKAVHLLVLVLIIVFLFVGCGKGGTDSSNNSSNVDSQENDKKNIANQTTNIPVQEELTITPTLEPTIAPTKEPDPVLAKKVVYTIADEILIDNEICLVKLSKAWYDYDGFCIDIICENKTTDQTLVFWMDDVIINGVYYPLYDWVNGELVPVHTWSNTISPKKNSTKRATVSVVNDRFFSADEIKFTIGVQDATKPSSDYLFYNGFTIYPTGKNKDTIKYPERVKGDNEVILVDNEDVSFILVYTPDIIEGWGHMFGVYIDNKTDGRFHVKIKNASINGIKVTVSRPDEVDVLPHSGLIWGYSLESDELMEKTGEYLEEIVFDLIVSDVEDTTKVVFEGKMSVKVR